MYVPRHKHLQGAIVGLRCSTPLVFNPGETLLIQYCMCVNVQVIYALTAHLKKTHTDAVALATFVDRKVSLATVM